MELHEEGRDQFGGVTCSCGFTSKSRAEQWKHAAEALRSVVRRVSSGLMVGSEGRWERVFEELVQCYGEGEDTDWAYLTDLASLIVEMIEREGAD